MVFKKFMASMGAGSAKVDTVLANPNVYPGGQVQGNVNLEGGKVDQDINAINLELVAKVEVEYENSEGEDRERITTMPFHKLQVAGQMRIGPGQRQQLPFTMDVPIETPITAVGGQPLRGMSVNVRTEVDIARAIDKGDLDPITVHPIPAQERLLAAFVKLGFRFKGADLEKGRLPGSTMPFYQEIEFHPADQYRRNMKELEVKFLAGQHALDVVLEVDRKGGLLRSGKDVVDRFTVDYASVDATDWEGLLNQQLTTMGQRRGWF